jgi:hypothetical protein
MKTIMKRGVKLRTIAANTFGMFLRDKLLIIIGALFICVILMMMTPLADAESANSRFEYSRHGVVRCN